MSKAPVHISELSTGHVMAVMLAIGLLFMQYAYPAIHLTSEFVPSDFVLWSVRLIVVFGYMGSWWFGASAIQNLHVYMFLLPEQNNMRMALKWISRGILLLITQFIVTGLGLKLTRAYALTSADALRDVHVVLNLAITYVPLLAFVCIFLGTNHLRVEYKAKRFLEYVMSYGSIILMGIGLLVAIFTDLYRFTPPPINGFPASFYLPDWVIVIFFVIPLFISWALAMQSALRLYSYGQDVSGSIYRKHYQRLSDGIRLTSFTIIITQCAIFTSNRLALSGMEVVISVLVVLAILSAYGFKIIAKGSRGLTAIETIV